VTPVEGNIIDMDAAALAKAMAGADAIAFRQVLQVPARTRPRRSTATARSS